MAGTRKTGKEALEEKIEKAEAAVIAAKKKYDTLVLPLYWSGKRFLKIKRRYCDL